MPSVATAHCWICAWSATYLHLPLHLPGTGGTNKDSSDAQHEGPLNTKYHVQHAVQCIRSLQMLACRANLLQAQHHLLLLVPRHRHSRCLLLSCGAAVGRCMPGRAGSRNWASLVVSKRSTHACVRAPASGACSAGWQEAQTSAQARSSSADTHRCRKPKGQHATQIDRLSRCSCSYNMPPVASWSSCTLSSELT